ncbi:methyltransferase-like protein 17, mitochondrial [Halichondria panicea]|uniref:methyltransferase-like protein 17, mitochondrial n=1 Tax=Halichondria panicea TaxID=6063 RepID=UPI00312B629D
MLYLSAAHSLWAESLYEYQCVDVSSDMGNLARVLRVGGEIPLQEPHPPTPEDIPGVHFRQYLPLSNKVGYDIVVGLGGHSLGEVHSLKLRRMFLASLWRKTRKYLVLVEPGNWTGFKVISEARDMILQAAGKWTRYEDESSEELEGHVFAPCPHESECPLILNSKLPCRFGQRVQLALSERNGPLKHKGYHLENFSYVVLKKGPRNHDEGVDGRILQPTKKRTKHILCKLCTRQGEVKDVILTKSKHRDVYRECRESKWGDTLTGLS